MTNDTKITNIILSRRRSLVVIRPGYKIDAPDVFVRPDALRDDKLPIVQLLPVRFLSRWPCFERRMELVYERFMRLKRIKFRNIIKLYQNTILPRESMICKYRFITLVDYHCPMANRCQNWMVQPERPKFVSNCCCF